MPLHVSSTCAHRQEVKIVLYSLWYHHTYRCDDTRDCIIQFCPPDDEHLCSKHVEAWKKLIIKFSASLVNIKINILRCTVSKISNQRSFSTLSFLWMGKKKACFWRCPSELLNQLAKCHETCGMNSCYQRTHTHTHKLRFVITYA